MEKVTENRKINMRIGIIIVVVIFSVVYGLLNYWVGKNILHGASSIFNINKVWFWSIFSLVAMSLIFTIALSRFLPDKVDIALNIIGFSWIVYILEALVIFLVINLIIVLVNILPIGVNLGAKSEYLRFIGTALSIIIFVIIAWAGSKNARVSYVNEIIIPKEETALLEPLNIALVSDIHLGTLIGNDRLSRMVQEVNVLNADIVIVAGDIVDTDITPFIAKNMAVEFSKLKSKYGTYVTLGNHDIMMGKHREIEEALSDNGVNVLRDEAVLVNDSFYVIGRDDVVIDRLNGPRKDLNEIVKSIDNGKYKIVVDHTPSSIEDSEEIQADLHLSGHTHRGQIAPANIITSRLFQVDHGHLQKGNLHIVVSSGYGTWGPPIRIGSRSEIINIKVQ